MGLLGEAIVVITTAARVGVGDIGEAIVVPTTAARGGAADNQVGSVTRETGRAVRSVRCVWLP